MGVYSNAIEHALHSSMTLHTASLSMAVYWNQYDSILGDIDPNEDILTEFVPDWERRIQDLSNFEARQMTSFSKPQLIRIFYGIS